ncbi:OpgC domain-containing protein [Chamaesiphon sp. VAR_69_metabat_338]|uniref:OpgC domain-containing protein n=1 Tax=Chamaesiphon sp. VAR_69_metabat_338 TaxID=2964704 RepID=UPI00286DE21B|nr:OpgC domain-containing protein [Chamaesiphon sp. VAR_69_metabat_338]
MSIITPPDVCLDLTSVPTKSRKLWQYDPDLYGKRDLRIDFLRGVAIVSMVVNHLECRSYFNNITQGHIYASSAEGFVFLSGFVLGFVTLQRIDKIGLNSAMQKLLERAKILYFTSFILIAGLGLLSIVAPGMTRPSFDRAPGEWWQILLAAGTLHLAPPIVDILQLYVLCLLASPAIFWLLRRGLLLPLLTASWTLWWIQQVHPYSFSLQPLDRAHPYFVFSTWQILYVHGVAAGYHKDRLAKTWKRLPKIPVLLGMLAIVIAALVTAHFDLQLGTWPQKVQDRALWLRLTDRSINGPIRLVTLLGLFSLMFMAVDRFWIPLSKTLGNLLIPLGQNSLYVYIIHVPLTLIWFMIPGLIQGSTWLVSLAQASGIGLCWWLVKKEVLFKIIPR